MDDYDQGRRSIRTYRSGTLTVETIKLADLLEVTLSTIVDLAPRLVDRCKYRIRRFVEESFTEEELELEFDNYPRLKPYSVKHGTI